MQTLYTDYSEYLMDMRVLKTVVSVPSQSFDDLRKSYFEEFEKLKPKPSLEAKRYELGRHVSEDYRIQYSKEVELRANEKLASLSNDKHTVVYNQEELGVDESVKQVFVYEHSITDSLRQSIMEQFDCLTGEEFELDTEEVENVQNTAHEDMSLRYSDEEVELMDAQQEQSSEEYEVDDGVSYEADYDSYEEEESDDYDSYEEDESEEESGEKTPEDTEEDSDDDYDSYDEDESEDDYASYDEEESEGLDEIDSDEDGYVDYVEDSEEDDDYDSYDEDELEEEDSTESDEDEYDEDSVEDNDYDSYDEDEEDDYSVEDDSEEDSDDEYDYDNEEEEVSDYEGQDIDDSDREANRVSDIGYSADNSTDSDISPAVSLFDTDLDEEDLGFVDKVEVPKQVVAEPPKQVVAEKPKEVEQGYVLKPDAHKEVEKPVEPEPTDLRQFIRKHPRCEYNFALQYFTKKQINDAIKVGKVIKRGNILKV